MPDLNIRSRSCHPVTRKIKQREQRAEVTSVRHPIAILAACLLPAAVAAQEQSAEIAEVLTLNNQLEAAIARGDPAAIAAFFAPEFRLQNSANRVLTAEQVLRQFATGATRFSEYSRKVEVAYQSGEVVILMGEESVTPEGGSPVIRRFTSVWRKMPGGWRQIARQSTNVTTSR